MELANPAGLWWLAALPLLLVPWLIRERPRRRLVAGLFLYRGLAPARASRLGGVLRLAPLFLLQLLLLLLAAGAATRPVAVSTSEPAALVVDNAASLGAAAGDGTRFDAAKRAAAEALASSSAERWDVFVLAPAPHEIASGVSRAEARVRLAALGLSACRHPDDGTLERFFESLSSGGYREVHVIGDRPARRASPFRVVTVGAPAANVAITDATLAPSRGSVDRVSLAAVVDNFSAAPVRVPIAAFAGDRRGGDGELEIAPGRSATFTAEVPRAERYRVAVDPGDADALAADDEAIVRPRSAAGRRVLLVASGPGRLGAVAKAIGFELEVVAPAAYRPERTADYDLVVFHLAAPKEPPPRPALYLLPPPAPFLPAEAARLSAPAIAFTDPAHPGLRYLNPGALRPRRALSFAPTPGWAPLAVGSSGAVLLERRGAGVPAAILSGIDLLPYLGDRNRPVSILTLDLLTFLLGRGPAALGGTAEGAGGCALLGRAESDLRTAPPLPVPETAAPPRARTVSRPLWAFLTIAALVLLALEWLLTRRGGWPATLLRLAVIALLVAAALDPKRATAAVTVPPRILVDVSASLLAETRARLVAEARAIAGAGAAVRLFAGRTVPATAADDLEARAGDAEPQATDLETALADAAGEPTGALLLVTDGWETRGEARRALDALAALDLRVYPVAAPQPLAANVAVESLRLPAEGVASRALQAQAVLRNDNSESVSGRVVFRQGTRVVERAEVTLAPGVNAVARPLLPQGDGLLEFSAEFTAARPEANRLAEDDAAKAWVGLRARRQVLILARSEVQSRPLERALTGRGFRVRVESSGAVPDLDGFGAVIVDDVAAGELPRRFPAEVEAWVRGGGALVMVGGPRGFGLGGWRGTPVEDALPVRMKPREREEARKAVALVIDKSGSMREEDRILYAREAARQLVDRLRDGDWLTVIGFDREAFTLFRLSRVAEIRRDFDFEISRLKPSGGTRLFPALQEARRELASEDAKQRHIIVLSDGLSEDADTAAGRRTYYDLALALSEQGVTVTTIALGAEADASFLERLAGYGRGAFHETRDPSTLPQLVLGAFEDEQGRERTMREEELRPLPSADSPLVGEIAREERRWPPVLGLVETELKRGARLDVGTAGTDLPLVASWQYGEGRAVAFTTDADGRWSDRWVRWAEWSRLWGGIVGWLLPGGAEEEESSSFAVAYREGALVVDYARFDDDAAGAMVARVTGPKGTSGEAALERLAPGHYRATFPTRAAGDFRIEVRGPRGAITRPALGFTVPAAAVAERPRREPDWRLLEEIAAATDGAVNPSAAAVRRASVEGPGEPIAPWLLGAAMLLFLTELTVRRMRAA